MAVLVGAGVKGRGGEGSSVGELIVAKLLKGGGSLKRWWGAAVEDAWRVRRRCHQGRGEGCVVGLLLRGCALLGGIDELESRSKEVARGA